MSRIGIKPIQLPGGVSVDMVEPQEGTAVARVTGPKGAVTVSVPRGIHVEMGEGRITCTSERSAKEYSALWGLTRALLANAVRGVTEGFSKRLEIEGIGYRAALEGSALVFSLGFSHPIRVEPPEGITFTVEKNVIRVSGADKQAVGEVAARIRALRKPEPYKGKGIRYAGEVIRRKAGKKAAVAVTK